MDKNAIKKYAVWARRELIFRVSQKALQYGITDKDIIPASATSVNGVVLSAEEMKQRKALIEQISAKGYKQVMEEVAYTWFNRFIALRFMEVNGYLPSHIRVFTDDNNAFRPQILTEAISLEMAGLDMEKVYDLKDTNDDDGLFKYLIIVQCNALSPILPGMFQRIDDYTELLFPDNLLRKGSVIEQMVSVIPEEDWKDAVQIIGWLYQYYNSEKKDEVFAALKKNVKITKENIPAATQLFTPDWIVRYMVENSLGRLWIEHELGGQLSNLSLRELEGLTIGEIEHRRIGPVTEADLADKFGWKYYLPEAQQEPEVQAQLAEIRKEYASMKPEQIKVIDPCAGSGHILAYLFDVLVQIYESYGYTAREAVRSIVENNIYGLDIDDRAAQLAYFSVMMKARQYDRRFLTRKDEEGNPDVPQPHVYAIVESNAIGGSYKLAMGDFLLSKEHQDTLNYLLDAFLDAKEYGSVLQLEDRDYTGLMEAWKHTASQTAENVNMTLWYSAIEHEVPKFIEQAILLTQKYDVIVTNPPYMGSSGMSGKLSDYVKKNYPDSKSDLFAVFIERCGRMTAKNRFQAMITQHAWMFLSSFEKLRGKLQQIDTINMAHLGPRAFEEIGGEVVQTTSFILRKVRIPGYKGTYCRLIEPTTQQGKEDMFLAAQNRYTATQDNFSKIPGSPVAYWVSEKFINIFTFPVLQDFADAKPGMSTTNNDLFTRLWYEVEIGKTKFDAVDRQDALASGRKWFPYNKGGEARKWYGNNDCLVNWEHDGEALKEYTRGATGGRMVSLEYFFKECFTWSMITTSANTFRYKATGSILSNAGPACFSNSHLLYLLGLMNSPLAKSVLEFISPTINCTSGNVALIPVKILNEEIVSGIVQANIFFSRADWDSFETSWDFRRHPLIAMIPKGGPSFEVGRILMSECYGLWETECNERFNRLKSNEEELNRIFIDIYGLQDELTPEVEDKDVTVRKADLGRDIRSFISYAVGCMFGRYSLYKDGLIFAGEPYSLDAWVEKMNDQPGIVSAEEIQRAYTNEGVVVNEMFFPDPDNIIPICDDEYFEDDIVGRFVKFVETVYGAETLDENLKFIAGALGGKGQPRDVIRNYFLNDFFKDHCKIYQKRPIYWLFDSGKKGGFRALIYLHRYQPDTIARMRTDYVHEQQARYRTTIADLEQRIASASTSERVKLNKRLKTLKDQAAEIQDYEEKIHHLADQYIAIDLDDGVKKNYAIFGDVLAKIK